MKALKPLRGPHAAAERKALVDRISARIDRSKSWKLPRRIKVQGELTDLGYAVSEYASKQPIADHAGEQAELALLAIAARRRPVPSIAAAMYLARDGHLQAAGSVWLEVRRIDEQVCKIQARNNRKLQGNSANRAQADKPQNRLSLLSTFLKRGDLTDCKTSQLAKIFKEAYPKLQYASLRTLRRDIQRLRNAS